MIIEKIIGQLNNHKFKNLLLCFCFFYLIVSIISRFYFNLEFQNILGFIGFLRGIHLLLYFNFGYFFKKF